MKIQTTALIRNIVIAGNKFQLNEAKNIDLEFSAIDTGGGFKDPILDFSFPMEDSDLLQSIREHQEFKVTLSDPRNTKNEAAFSYYVEVDIPDNQINGRLKNRQLDRTLIGFVLQLLR